METTPQASEIEVNEYTDDDADANGNGHTPDDGSVVGWLRRRREEIKGGHKLVLEVPGWSGRLHCRYRPIKDDVLDRFRAVQRRLEREEGLSRGEKKGGNNVQLTLATDLIIAACGELLYADDPESDLAPLADQPGVDADGPIRWDKQLAKILNIQSPDGEDLRARQIVWGTFPRDDDGQVISTVVIAHAERIDEWLADVAPDVEQELGEA